MAGHVRGRGAAGHKEGTERGHKPAQWSQQPGGFGCLQAGKPERSRGSPREAGKGRQRFPFSGELMRYSERWPQKALGGGT
jgi:hypothetical protein